MLALSDEDEAEIPAADVVAWAIVASARETGADPIEVGSGARGNRHHPEVLRARAYAAIALRAEYECFSTTAIARMVGVPKASAGAYHRTLDQQRDRGWLDWWDDAVFMRIVAVVELARSG